MIDYARFYDREMEQRDQLRSAIATPLGLISLLGALTAAIVRAFQFTVGPAAVIVSAALIVACALLAAAIYYLIRCYHGHTYKGIQTAGELKKYRDDLAAWYSATGSNPDHADTDTEAYLADSYAQAAHHNAEVNALKWNYLFLANRRIIYATLAIAVAFPVYLRDQLSERPETIQVFDAAPDLKRAILQHGRQTATKAGASAASTPAATSAPGAAAPKGPARGKHP